MATSATPGSLSRLITSPVTRISGWPGMLRSVADHDPARPVLLGAGRLGDRRGHRRRGHPGGPQHGAQPRAGSRCRPGRGRSARRCQPGSRPSACAVRPPACAGAGRLVRQLRAERGQRGVAAVEQQHPGVLGLDVAVLVAQRLRRHLADLPGQLDARGPGADQGEGELAAALRRIGRALGHLERAEHPAPDEQGVLDGFHPRRPPGELVVAEVGLLHPGRHDQVVVAEARSARRAGAGPAPGAARRRCRSPRPARTRHCGGVSAHPAAGRRSSPRTGCRSRTGTAAAGTGGARPGR